MIFRLIVAVLDKQVVEAIALAAEQVRRLEPAGKHHALPLPEAEARDLRRDRKGRGMLRTFLRVDRTRKLFGLNRSPMLTLPPTAMRM